MGALAVTSLTWCFSGSFGFSIQSWREGQIAPAAIHAPFSFTVQDKDHPIEVKNGDLIVSRGERLTSAHIDRLRALEGARSGSQRRSHGIGAFLLAGLFTVVGARALMRYERVVWESFPKLILVVLVVAGSLGLGRLILESPLETPAWIPVSCVSMLLSMLLSPRLGMTAGFLVTLLTALMSQADLPLVAGWGIGCFVGAYAVKGIRRRMDFYRAGLFTMIAQGLVILASALLAEVPLEATFAQSLAGSIGALFSTAITFSLLPICESVFGLITDVTLLELSDLNHPLLKELSVKAPGTYHHSLLVANLAEAACEAVGANPLLARVGSYFHDIGKMLHPEYFVENQPSKTSRHERLLPSMSSLVILNHVKDGIELARRARLNQTIIDFIPGHHGTGLIYYFYRRALEEVEDEALLKEERFRYPGPKPHSRETAVVLLADSVEAATRSLREKSPARIQDVVRRIINNKFIDGQLDHCTLTLSDLHRISEAFLRVLAGIYHSRIEYPVAPGEEPQEGQDQAMSG